MNKQQSLRFITFSRDDPLSKSIEETLVSTLTSKGYVRDDTHPDIVVFIGGDGTFLRSFHAYNHLKHKMIFVGVHTGTIGFFCDYSPEQLDQLVTDFPSLSSKTFTYPLLEMKLHAKEVEQTFYAINEVRIENPFQTFVTQVYIDHTSLESFRGTGLVISTSLGSSAYNKSLGGALVDVDLKTMQLTEMAPIHNTSYRSLGSSYVLSSEKIITLKGQFDSVIFGYDHELVKQTHKIEAVTVQTSEKTVSLVHRQNTPYLGLLQKTFIG